MRNSVFIPIITIITICCVSIVPINAQCLEDQRSLLLQLKNTLIFNSSFSTKLVQWNHHNKDCCLWEGITCSKAGHVTGLDLNGESISGGIDNSSSLFSLRFLQSLNLADNYISGPFPNSIGNLAMLSMMDMANSNFTGRIPKSMRKLTQLAYLDLSYNMFTGAVPWLQMSKKLTHIDLSYNNLSGPLSFTQFEGFVNLEYIDLQFNSFTGRIPSSLFGLPSLKQLLLSNNHFDGSLAKIPNASSSMLETLDLKGNKLEGEIPSSFFDLKSLDTLYLLSNNLNGTIQLENFQKLVNLTTLDLSFNNLSIKTGGNHSGLYPFPQFTSLKLASCKLRNFPDLKNQRKMFDLDLGNNQIGGEIPNWIWKVGNGSIRYLNLSLNFLENLQEPYVIPSLIYLDLHSNHLRGKLPLPPDTAMHVDYSSNYFSSSIPDGIGVSKSWPPNLRIIDIASNNFFGALIPQYFLEWKAMMDDPEPEVKHLQFNLGNGSYYYRDTVTVRNKGLDMDLVKILTVFTAIDFSMNNFEGNIPETIGELISLYVLNLSHNGLTGSIPSSLGNLKQLGSLDISVNELIGKIPQELASITFLSALNLSYNKLTGKIPSGNQFTTFAETSFEGNEGLCGPQLNKSCSDIAETVPTFKDKHSHPADGKKWEFLSAASVGFIVGLGFVIGPLFFCERWSKWYWKHIDRVVLWIVNQKGQGSRNRERTAYKKPIRRL
ncbi:hypothetical protein LguiB_005883 [Lonicera macranthoides]